MTGRSGKSREIGGHPQSSLKARAAVKASRQVKAPFCRQGAATPAKHRMSSGREAQRYNSATPQAVRLEASLPTTIVVKGRAA